jgi:hypothetical protein
MQGSLGERTPPLADATNSTIQIELRLDRLLKDLRA